MDGVPRHDSLVLNLDELLGGTEMIPVDNFWNSYVDELSSRSKRQADQGLVPGAAKHLRAEGPSALPAAAYTGLQGLPPGLSPLELNSLAASNDLALLQSVFPGAGSGLQPANPLAAAQGGAVAGQAAAAAAATAAAGLALSPTLRQLSDNLTSSSGGGLEGADAAQQANGGEAPRRKISKKKQESNKAAQQRYRERKKAQFCDMESRIEELTQQLDQMRALQDRNSLLEAQNTSLEARLVEREQQIEKLKLSLDRFADSSLERRSAGAQQAQQGAAAAAAAAAAAGACGASGDASDGGANGDEGPTCVSCEALPLDLAVGVQEQQGQVQEQIERLRQFVQEHKLGELDPSGAELPQGLLRQLVALVGRTCQLCQAAIRAGGARVLDLMDSDPHSLSGPDGSSGGGAGGGNGLGRASNGSGSGGAAGQQQQQEAEQARWARVLAALRLSQPQAAQLLLQRQAHLAKMQAIYQERQGLNMQAMSLMLPHAGRHPYDDGTVEGRMGGIASGGYMAVARSSAELGVILDKIKENLRREQRAVLELNCLTVSKILTPLQAAHYMTESFPYQCDALKLSNLLAAQQAQQAQQQKQ